MSFDKLVKAQDTISYLKREEEEEDTAKLSTTSPLKRRFNWGEMGHIYCGLPVRYSGEIASACRVGETNHRAFPLEFTLSVLTLYGDRAVTVWN